VERELWNAIIDELRKRGHSVQANEYGTHPSAVQVIQRLGDAWCAGSDPRTEGLAAGF
jgi:gamma-glutamyltranspeptidase